MGLGNIFYLIFLINLLQFSLTKPIEPKTPKDKLMKFYATELNKISKEFCVKAKNLSEELLKDERIKRAVSQELNEFKKNLEEYLKKFESLGRYELYDDLVTVFDKATNPYAVDEDQCSDDLYDTCYIQNLLFNLGFNELSDEYENNYYRLVVEKYLPKTEEFKSQLNAEELKNEQKFFEWLEELKLCTDYSCQYEVFPKYFDTPESKLEEYINKYFFDLILDYCNRAANISETILKDVALQQTDTPIVKEFRKNITEFIEKFSSNKDSDQLYDIGEIFSNATDFYVEMPEDKQNSDSKLIANILRKLGSEQLEEEYEEKLKDFASKELKEKFDEFKSQLNEEELQKEQPLLKWYEELKLNIKNEAKALKKLNAL